MDEFDNFSLFYLLILISHAWPIRPQNFYVKHVSILGMVKARMQAITEYVGEALSLTETTYR